MLASLLYGRCPSFCLRYRRRWPGAISSGLKLSAFRRWGKSGLGGTAMTGYVVCWTGFGSDDGRQLRHLLEALRLGIPMQEPLKDSLNLINS